VSASPLIHPIWLRLTHWINAIAVTLMVLSGWRIYNASPIFDFSFPRELTLGGWLAGAIQWHFAAMWLLGANFVLYLAINIASGRLARKFFPLSPKAVVHDLREAIRGRLSHADPTHYNAVQKLAYLVVMVDIIVLVASGLVIWKPVQFSLLRGLMGDFDNARIVHFCAMAILVGFFFVHVAMVALVPRTLRMMIAGR
jgi:thiosulfate reductase cytochrome b subunit